MSHPTYCLKPNLFRQWGKRSTKDPLKESGVRTTIEPYCPRCGFEYYRTEKGIAVCLSCGTHYKILI